MLEPLVVPSMDVKFMKDLILHSQSNFLPSMLQDTILILLSEIDDTPTILYEKDAKKEVLTLV